MLRQQFHPRAILVQVCDPVGQVDIDALKERLRAEPGVVGSVEQSTSCAHPLLDTADSLTESLIIRRLAYTDTTSIIDVGVARNWRLYPGSWDEVYVQWTMGAAIEIRNFPAVN
ncbi:MAG TPA: hypothetical protein PLL69_03605 [Gemmatimonadales bacterium]|nr:hypothetical protein [Gemmatimonadales bacterium]